MAINESTQEIVEKYRTDRSKTDIQKVKSLLDERVGSGVLYDLSKVRVVQFIHSTS